MCAQKLENLEKGLFLLSSAADDDGGQKSPPAATNIRRHSSSGGGIFHTALPSQTSIMPKNSEPVLLNAAAATEVENSTKCCNEDETTKSNELKMKLDQEEEVQEDEDVKAEKVPLTFSDEMIDEKNGSARKRVTPPTTIKNGGFSTNTPGGNKKYRKQSSSMLRLQEFADLAKKEKDKKTKLYYKKQMDLVKNFREDERIIGKYTRDVEDLDKDDEEDVESMITNQRQPEELVSRSEDILSKITLAVNVCLLISKGVAAGLSGSLVVIGSVVDSATDITAGLVIHLTNRAIMNRDMYEYPRGRTRLQPIALVIISVIMGACSVQVISKSLESIVRGTLQTDVDTATIVIMAMTILVKFILSVVCYIYQRRLAGGSPSTAVLAQDHRNDTISNAVALICAYVANKVCVYIDPAAAIVVSVYILITWLRTGNEHVKSLSGRGAKPALINRIVKICLDHRPTLKQIDTVYAYHFGTKYLVEVHVVLDERLSLREAHDIAEPLQRKIEHLPYVERAFVHIDYETEHRPEFEHKVV